jgi:inosine-uridine nucleoside N-ribohydrolase
MKQPKLTLLLIGVLLLSIETNSQTRIIFDTDFGSDADDLGALAMLHHFVDRNECKLEAVMCWSTEQYAVSAIDAVNRFYAHPDIPIGARKDSVQFLEWNYSKAIADRFPYTLDHQTVPDAVALYRKILSESSDKSLVIVTVGPLKNIENLLESPGDSISPLSGEELVEQKVREFVMMGGRFPEGKWEWNFAGGMPGVTRNVISRLHIPITFTGFEVGVAIQSAEAFNRTDPETPLYVGFMHFSENAPWMKGRFKGAILNNSTFDQTAVLYAVRNGTGKYWDKVSDGLCVPDEKGGNNWIQDGHSNHSYLKLTMDQDDVVTALEEMMLGTF